MEWVQTPFIASGTDRPNTALDAPRTLNRTGFFEVFALKEQFGAGQVVEAGCENGCPVIVRFDPFVSIKHVLIRRIYIRRCPSSRWVSFSINQCYGDSIPVLLQTPEPNLISIRGQPCTSLSDPDRAMTFRHAAQVADAKHFTRDFGAKACESDAVLICWVL
jgi:hypothetical protein